jgi:hypothetical protein
MRLAHELRIQAAAGLSSSTTFPVSSSDFRLERISGHPPDTASLGPRRIDLVQDCEFHRSVHGLDIDRAMRITFRFQLRCYAKSSSELVAAQYVEHTEGDGGQMFKAACKLGLEGIVSKKLDAPYRSGPSKAWLKITNPKAPAAARAIDGTF